MAPHLGPYMEIPRRIDLNRAERVTRTLEVLVKCIACLAATRGVAGAVTSGQQAPSSIWFGDGPSERTESR